MTANTAKPKAKVAAKVAKPASKIAPKSKVSARSAAKKIAAKPAAKAKMSPKVAPKAKMSANTKANTRAKAAPKAKVSANEKMQWKEQQAKYVNSAKEMFENFAAKMKPTVDKEAMMASHKKNLEALNDASKMAVDVMKSITHLQGQFVRQTFEDFSRMMKDAMSKKPSMENMKASAQGMQHTMQKAMQHASNVGQVLAKSGQQIHARLQEHQEEIVDEMKAHASKYKH